MDLRPYQNDFVSGVAHAFHKDFRRVLGVLPTGGGKTICFAKIAERFHLRRGEKTLILAHREELVEQAAAKVLAATGIPASIEKAGRHADPDATVVVGSIQTMQGKRLRKWAPDHFGLIVCDEAHHVLAKQWQATLDYFDARVLGVTATPDRGDRQSLAKYFEHLAYQINLLDLIEAKFLSGIMVHSVPLRIDLTAVKTVKGDFDSTGLDSAISPYLAQIAKHIAEHCRDRKKIVVFLPLIATSQRFVELCRAEGINARHIDGMSPDRKEILSDFTAGTFDLLSNAMLLTEGWDEPGVDCIIVLRPTRSRSLYAQMVGRGTRVHPGKDHLLLLDFLWMHQKHNLCKPASLVARSKKEEDEITAQITDEKTLTEATGDAAAEREAALARELAENARRKASYAPLGAFTGLLRAEVAPGQQPVSEKQAALLAKYGIRATTRNEATAAIGRIMARQQGGLATPKQLIWLQRLKHPSPETATAKEAKEFLDSKWKKTDKTSTT